MPLAVIQSSSLNQDRSEGEAAGVVSTARVERGPSQAARSASTETMAAAPPSSPSLTHLVCRGPGVCIIRHRNPD